MGEKLNDKLHIDNEGPKKVVEQRNAFLRGHSHVHKFASTKMQQEL